MESFYHYLQFTKQAIKNVSSYNDLHLVLGNESCDMDSTVSSILLAYLLHNHRSLGLSTSTLIIAVMNVSYKNFPFRSDNCFILQEAGISLDWLIYRDELDFNELLKTRNITVSLVDHHILSKNDAVLEGNVVQIFDHRPVDPCSNWNDKKVKLNIQQVGSCASLIAEEIFRVDEHLINRELGYLIYETIIYDTVALQSESGRAKILDVDIVEKLENKFNFKETRKIVYDKLRTAHSDVSHLTPKQMLCKDMKIVENIPVPGLPMLVTDFLKLDHAYNDLESFANEYKGSVLLIIGINTTKEVRKEIGIYWKAEGTELKEVLLNKLYNSREIKGYDFSFSEVSTGHSNVICLSQGNVTLSRKQIIPIVKDAVVEKCLCTNKLNK